MKYSIYIFILVFLIISCQNEEPQDSEIDPCGELVDGVYLFPQQNPDSTLTNEEKREYWNIPTEVLECITTEGLIISCYNTKFPILISAGTGYQHGYQVLKGWNRGFEELETRDDSPGFLIEFYKDAGIPTQINYNLFCVEVLMAQEAILTKLTGHQKALLLNLCFERHPEFMKIWTKSGFMYDGTVVIMCQMMRLDNYQPFLEYVKPDSYMKTFVDGYSYSLTFERGDSIVRYAREYLQTTQ